MKKRVLVLLGVLVLAMSGCGTKKDTNDTENGNSSDTENGSEEILLTEIDVANMFTDRDYETSYDESKSAVIQLNGDSATCKSDAVQISKSTITITDEGTYILKGTLDNGMIIVDAGDKDKPQLVLDNVSITSETSAPIYVLEANKVFVTMAKGSSNTLSNGGAFTAIDENNIDAVIYSKQDLTLNGDGTLTVSSPAGHGIVSKDDLVFTSGTYIVDSASKGLDANDSVRITGADFTISSGKDGVHAENTEDTTKGFVYIADGTFDIAAEGDGISASSCMQIDDGEYKIVSGGGSGNASKSTSDSWGNFGGGRGEMGGGRGEMGGNQGQMQKPDGTGNGMPEQMNETDIPSQEGSTTTETDDDSSTSIKAIKSAGNLVINDGTFEIDSADDAVHTNSSVNINGGAFSIATGDDGFHADETVTISSGTIDITESYEGIEGLHIKVSGGDIKLVASDDGLNAAGGTDSSGTGGVRGGDRFGGGGLHGGDGQFGGGGSSNGSIEISGGSIYMQASGDGIDANGTLAISGGTTTVCGPTSGDTSVLDYDSSATITGGTFIGTGGTMMAQSFSTAKQGVIAITAGNQSAGTKLTVQDSDGNVLASTTPELSYALIIISTPQMESGESYTVTLGTMSEVIEAE